MIATESKNMVTSEGKTAQKECILECQCDDIVWGDRTKGVLAYATRWSRGKREKVQTTYNEE